MTTTRAAIEQALAAGPTDKGAVMADVSVEARERMRTENIRDDGTVDGWRIETHYTPCKGIADANGYLRVLVDEEGYDTETRILHETLNGIGWVKSAALSANNQERAEAGRWNVEISDDYIPRRLRLTIGVQSFDMGVQDHADEPGRMEWYRDQLTGAMNKLAATSTKPVDEVNEWKEAVLDALANSAIDAEQSEPPRQILARILEVNASFPRPTSGAAVKEEPVMLTPDDLRFKGWQTELEWAVECLRDHGHVTDDEGDFTDSMAALLEWLRTQPPTAEPTDPAYPFYELKFIMRVLGHKGGAPKQDWDTAYGMAREIFSRWHKDRQATAEGQTNEPTDDEIFAIAKQTSGALELHQELIDFARAILRRKA